MEYTKLKNINEYKSETVNPMNYPDTVFEMYSVPIYNTGHPEYLCGSEIGSSKVIVRKNDVLICKINPRINRVWVVSDESEYQNIASSEWIVVRSSTYNPDFLAWYFRSKRFKELMTSEVTGIGGSLTRAQPKAVAEYPVPIVPEDRQFYIVDVLNRVSSVITARRQELLMLDELIKARFVEMFGDPEAGTCRYGTKKLGELSVKISDGVHAKPNYTETGRPFLSVVNINKGIVDFTDCKYVSEEAYKKMIKSTHPENGDVLYTKVGATYGIPAYVDTDKEFCLYVSVCLIKPKHERINARFLSIQMGMPSIKHQADARIKGIGVPDLHLNQIREFNIICPPRALQDEFVAFVDQVDKSKAQVQKALDETQLLFDSLMQEYFG